MGRWQNLKDGFKVAYGGYTPTILQKAIGSSITDILGIGGGNGGNEVFENLSTAELIELKQKIAVVFRCVTVKAQAFQEAPLTLVLEKDDGPEILAMDSDLLVPFKYNPWMSESTFMRYISEHLDLAGACYLWKWPNVGMNRTNEIWPIPPQWVTPLACGRLGTDEENRTVAGFRVTFPGGEQIYIPNEEMIYIRHINPGSLFLPCSPMGAAEDDAQSYQKSAENRADLMENARTPGIVITSDKPITPRQKKDIHRVLEEKLGEGARKNTLTLGGMGIDIKMLNPLENFDYKALAELDESHICMVFGVPALVAGTVVGLENSPWSNTGDAWRSFYKNTMTGVWKMVETELSRNLIGVDNPALHYEFDTSEIIYLHEEADGVADRAIKLFHAGLRDRNEARAMTGADAVEEEFGKDTVQPMNLITVGMEEEPPLTPEEQIAEVEL